MISTNKESINDINNDDDDDDDDEPIKDEEVRKHLRILSTRLYDLKERFMKVIQKITNDAVGFVDQIEAKDDTTDEESDKEMSVDEDNADATRTSSGDTDDGNDDENLTQKSRMRLRMSKLLIQSILERKARRYEYLKHVVQYPKLMKYLLDESSDCTNISLRHLEPFIKGCVEENPNGKIYDKVNDQIQDIRRKYIKNRQ